MARVWIIALLVAWSTSAFSSQDPTAPLGWQAPKTQTVKPRVIRKPLPKLQSIVCVDEASCRAILNGQVVLAGEQVNGYQVKKIESEVVTISRNGKQWKLNLFSLEVKK